MALDVLVGIFLVALVALGYRKGALSQVTWMASVGLAFVGSSQAGAVLSQVLYGGAAEGLVGLGLRVMGGSAIFLAVAVVGGLLVRALRRDENTPSSFDRFGGALLGFGKATVVAYGAAWLIGGISPSLEQADPQDALRLRDSELVRLAQGVRPFFAQAAEPAPVSSLE
jgi:hypothetical protein